MLRYTGWLQERCDVMSQRLDFSNSIKLHEAFGLQDGAMKFIVVNRVM